MITLLPTPAAAAWFAQNGWWLLLAAAVITACVWKAMLHGTNSDGWSDSNPADGSGDGCG
jgi:hypothetical protein